MVPERDLPRRNMPTFDDWPDQTIPDDVLEQIIAQSKVSPLRETVAERVVREGQELLRRFIHNPSFYGHAFNDPNFTRRFYYGQVGKGMTYACNLHNEGLAAVDRITAERRREAMVISEYIDTDVGMIMAIKAEDLRRHIPAILRQVNTSIAIDPTGFDLHTKRDNTNDPKTPFFIAQAEGLRRGRIRYKSLYTEAVKNGATQDFHTHNLAQRQLLRVKRFLEDRIVGVFLAPPSE